MGQPAADSLASTQFTLTVHFLPFASCTSPSLESPTETMLDFMDYVQLAFAEATSWNQDNSYSALTTTAQCKPLWRQGCATESV